MSQRFPEFVYSCFDFLDFLFYVLLFSFQIAFVRLELFKFLFRRRRSPQAAWGISVWLLRLRWCRRWRRIAVAVGHRVRRRVVPVTSSSSPVSSGLTHIFHLLPVGIRVPSVRHYGIPVTIAVAHPRIDCVGISRICPPPSRKPWKTGAYPRVIVWVAESPTPPASSESAEQPSRPLPWRQVAERSSSWPWSCPTSSSPTPSHVVHLYFVIFHIIFGTGSI